MEPDLKSIKWVNVAVIGPAQHGKSTLTGFLLDAHAEVHARVMREAEQAARQRNDLSRIYAFLLDRDPQERTTQTGVGRGQSRRTSWWGIDSKPYRLLLMDSPGQYHRVAHTLGAISEADALLLVVDVRDYLEALPFVETWRDQHGQFIPGSIAQIRALLATATFFGIKQLVIAAHKLDLTDYSEQAYTQFTAHLSSVLDEIGWDHQSVSFVPTAVLAEHKEGHTITERKPPIGNWYAGPTLAELIGRFKPRPHLIHAPFRMQVGQVFQGNRVRVPGYELVITGKILTGTVQIKDEIVLLPSGHRCAVRTIKPIDSSRPLERADRWEEIDRAEAGDIVGLGCRVLVYGEREQVAIGDMILAPSAPARRARQLRAELVVLNSPDVLAPVLASKFAGQLSLGYFSTGFMVQAFSFDDGKTWQQSDQYRGQPSAPLEDWQFRLHEGRRILVDIELAREAPLDIHIEGSSVGRFVLLDPNLFLLCGGVVRAILN